MNEQTAIRLARQRMREIGKKPEEYHIESVGVIGTEDERLTGRIEFEAFNQYYYLVNDETYFGFEIYSDSAYFNSDDHTSDTRQEFTGQITIRKTVVGGAWSLVDDSGFAVIPKQAPVKFIRVTIF